MAGENTLPAQYYPDDFQILTFTLTNTGLLDPTAILYADRNFIVDSIIVYTRTANGSAATGSFEITTDPTADTGTAMAVADLNLTAGTTLFLQTDGGTTPATVASDGTAGTSSNSTQLSNTGNFIPQGSFIVIDLSAGTTWRGFIQIRLRSRPK
jgi:hypothetical protein